MTTRALLLVALLAPAGASAQILTAGKAELRDSDAKAQTNYIGLAMCQGGTDTLAWTLDTGTGGFQSSGTYQLSVSDHAPDTTGQNRGFCPADNKTTGVNTAVVSAPFNNTTGPSDTIDVVTGGIPGALNIACDAATPQKQIYLCVEWTNNGQKAGFADATLTLQYEPPPAPVKVRSTPNESSLDVAWDAGTPGAGQVESVAYQAVATAGAESHTSKRVTGTAVTFDGLHNGTQYTVVVYAFSRGNNQSAASAELSDASTTPIPIADFWEHYKDAGGTDSGGCASGPAGLGALAGLALARVVRRRHA